MISKKILVAIEALLSQIPVLWDGRKAIMEMKNSGSPHWRQMEWVGWYFEFLCDRALLPLITGPRPKFGKVFFDALIEIPWDFKAHPDKNAEGKDNNKAPINDKVAITQAIKKFGGVGLIIAIGEATFNDKDRSFQLWHKELKGGLSAFEKNRIARKAPSRLRKTKFKLKEIRIFLLDKTSVKTLGSFQKGFRNSNGNLRKEKKELDLNKIKPLKVIKF